MGGRQPVQTNRNKKNNMKNTLETKIETMLPEGEAFDVIAHELWGEDSGWSVNDSWYLCKGADKARALECARGRWEVFKVNYSPRAKIKELSDDGDETVAYINAAGIPFLEIRSCN